MNPWMVVFAVWLFFLIAALIWAYVILARGVFA